ncbi:MAG: DUF2079 domain-containing protein, partial [Candidatus Kerfeldbacteria bacterium]|nr:DUF2079 domain-containing protein [Candidatus Kerfeldbacteria bacterium]
MQWMERRALSLVFVCAGIYTVLFSALSIWKERNFGYNALDLGIFTQVAWNTAYGRFFDFTIHPHSYLGDHFEPFLLVLAAFMRLAPRPETLLVLQSVIIASGAIPVFLIARLFLSRRSALGLAVLYLANPILHSMNLFEFHLLPLALPLLLFAALFFLQGAFVPFCAAMALSLLVREDVALVTILFCALAIQERRPWKWTITPLIFSVGWFSIALSLIGKFNTTGTYKFAYYYSWLGPNAREIMQTVFADPQRVLEHLVTLQHVAFLAGLLLPLALLPLLAPRFLLLALLPWLQIALSSFGASVLALETHYPTLLLPGLFVAAVEGFRFLYGQPVGTRVQHWIHKRLAPERSLVWITIFAATVYSAFTLGPLGAFARHGASGGYDNTASEQQRMILDEIPRASSVAASYSLLAPLATREQLFSMHYAFIGQKQYSTEPYTLPSDVEYLVIDGWDLLTYPIQYAPSRIHSQNIATGAGRLRALTEDGGYDLMSAAGERTLWKKSSKKRTGVVTRSQTIPTLDAKTAAREGTRTLEGLVRDDDMPKQLYNPETTVLVPLSLVWSVSEKQEDTLQLRISLLADGTPIWDTLSPLAFGLYPTNEWRIGEYIQTRHWLLVPRDIVTRADSIAFDLVTYDATLGLTALRSAGHIGATVTPLFPNPLARLPLDSPILGLSPRLKK